MTISMTPQPPKKAAAGSLWFDSQKNKMYMWSGDRWVETAGGSHGQYTQIYISEDKRQAMMKELVQMSEELGDQEDGQA